MIKQKARMENFISGFLLIVGLVIVAAVAYMLIFG